MLIERIMSDFSVQFYLDNPEFVLHLSPENIEKFRARYDECGASGTLLATKLIETVQGLDGEFKYMKNTEIASATVPSAPAACIALFPRSVREKFCKLIPPSVCATVKCLRSRFQKWFA